MILYRSEDRELAWEVRAKSSTATYAGDGKVWGDVSGMEGHLYEESKIASKVWADKGYADQRTGVLIFEGNVKVVATEQGARLTAKKVEWKAAKKLIEAEGGVEVDQGDFIIGPFAKVLATPDLKRVGTPDQFHKEAK